MDDCFSHQISGKFGMREEIGFQMYDPACSSRYKSMAKASYIYIYGISEKRKQPSS